MKAPLPYDKDITFANNTFKITFYILLHILVLCQMHRRFSLKHRNERTNVTFSYYKP